MTSQVMITCSLWWLTYNLHVLEDIRKVLQIQICSKISFLSFRIWILNEGLEPESLPSCFASRFRTLLRGSKPKRGFWLLRSQVMILLRESGTRKGVSSAMRAGSRLWQEGLDYEVTKLQSPNYAFKFQNLNPSRISKFGLF